MEKDYRDEFKQILTSLDGELPQYCFRTNSYNERLILNRSGTEVQATLTGGFFPTPFYLAYEGIVVPTPAIPPQLNLLLQIGPNSETVRKISQTYRCHGIEFEVYPFDSRNEEDMQLHDLATSVFKKYHSIVRESKVKSKWTFPLYSMGLSLRDRFGDFI